VHEKLSAREELRGIGDSLRNPGARGRETRFFQEPVADFYRASGRGDERHDRYGYRGDDSDENGGAYSRSVYVSLFKWDLNFSGHGVFRANQFSERVEELVEARGLPHGELFRGALELLSGEALVWFRNNKVYLRNWEEFKKELLAEFLPKDYEMVLGKEIRGRKQGPNERVSSLVTAMLGMFNRLQDRGSEATKLKIILRNLRPDLRLVPCVKKTNSILELQDIGRELDFGTSFESGSDSWSEARTDACADDCDGSRGERYFVGRPGKLRGAKF